MYYTILYLLYYTVLYYTQHIIYQWEAVLSTCVPWGGVKQSFYWGHLRPSENMDIVLQFITVAKAVISSSKNNFVLGSTKHDELY